MKPFKRSQYQYNKKTIFYFILFYFSHKFYVSDKGQFTTTRRINHRAVCRNNSDRTLFYQKPIKHPQPKDLTNTPRFNLVNQRRYHPVPVLILSLISILFHCGKVYFQYQNILKYRCIRCSFL